VWDDESAAESAVPVLVNDLDLVVVVKADPLEGQHGGGPWSKEKANLNLVGDFIASLGRR
jgi:hypothetical protein